MFGVPQETLFGLIAGLLGIALLLIPVLYIRYKRGCNQWLFLYANLGANTLIVTAYTILCAPFIALNLMEFPSLADGGGPRYLIIFLEAADWVSRYWSIIASVIAILLYCYIAFYLLLFTVDTLIFLMFNK